MTNAIVKNNQVINVVAGSSETCDMIAKQVYGEDAYAVPTGKYPVEIGDRYLDEIFYRYVNYEWIPLEET